MRLRHKRIEVGVRIRISHLLKNVGATKGQRAIIRAGRKRDFATCAQSPFPAWPEAASDLEFKRRAELGMASPGFFAFGIEVTAGGQRKVDRRFHMDLLFLRDSTLCEERLVELHESLELERAAGLHRKRDDR